MNAATNARTGRIDKNVDPTPFERNLSQDQRLLIIILGAMGRITNQNRIQSIAYLLKTLMYFPFAYKFRLTDHPVSDSLAWDLFRLRSERILGERLVQTRLLDSDSFTSLPRNAEYTLTPFAKILLANFVSKDHNCARLHSEAEVFSSKIWKNGYVKNIERYASWTYICKDIRPREPKEVISFYEKEHEFKHAECEKFLNAVVRP